MAPKRCRTSPKAGNTHTYEQTSERAGDALTHEPMTVYKVKVILDI
jgi:hypothetical protein